LIKKYSSFLQYGAEIQFTRLWTIFKIQMKWLTTGGQIFMTQHQIWWLILRRLFSDYSFFS